ncbi:amino acid adenylation domain-containing protein, partial [Burkholderia ubonensis]
MYKNTDSNIAFGGDGPPFNGNPDSLHRLIEWQAARTPEHEALRCGGQSLTYAELERRANQCAHYLRELGVGPDDIIGVCMERSLELVVALVAILKAGGAYLPLDPGYPDARLRFMLDDAAVSVVLTQQRHTGLLAGFSGTVLPLDSKADYLTRYPHVSPVSASRPGDLAYVIYTSGSTGQPKGCLLTHGAICNRLLWMQDEYGLRAGDRVLQKTPYTFDVSVWEFFWPLLAGATLVLAAPQGHKDSHYLVGLIRAERITVCHFVPSMLRLFLNDADAASCTSLRDVFTSGEALPFELVERFKALLPARLHNLYGPTEAAVDVSYWPCELRPDRRAPIGRAIRNIRLYVLDDARRRVPPGHEGELYIAGAGLARGYLKRPALTAERFVDDPFHPGEKMYRTGDRVVELDDGNLDFLGRIDFQVKLRGLRIELGEIEVVLRQIVHVREAAVMVRGEEDGDPRLVAYLETDGATLDPKQVRRHVATRLPDYMVPNRVVSMPRLPLTPHGKLDRGALPWPVPAAGAVAEPAPEAAADAVPATASAGHAPAVATDTAPVIGAAAGNSAASPSPTRTPMHARIDAIVAAMLKRDDLAPDTDLFDAGATSLTLVRVVEQIREAFGVAVPLHVLLDMPTIAGIVAYVTAHAGPARVADAASDSPVTTPEPAGALADLPLPPVAYRPDARLADGAACGFSGAPISFEALSAWLGLLMAGAGDGDARFRYPSGGGLNPVRIYVHVRAGGVPGLPEGGYYYHPEAHALYRVGTRAAQPDALFGADAARYARAAFAVLMVAEMDAIEPLYRQAAAPLAALEAGYISQLLLAAQGAHGFVAAPATGVNVEALAPALDLAATERFVHCLLAGVPAAGARMEASASSAHAAYSARLCVQHDAADTLFAGEAAVTITSEQLHRERRHLRRLPADTPCYALASTPFDWSEHRLRATCRDYLPEPVGLAQLGRLLGMLRPQPAGQDRPYLYGAVSASRHLVIYVYTRGGEVPEGLYRYDADTHRLTAVAGLTAAQVQQIYTPYNRRHFKQGSFCLFVFGRCDPAASRQAALHAALLDAGHAGQLLLERQAEFGIGLCPVGAVRLDPIRQAFALGPDLELLHSFIGGGSAREVPPSRRRIEAGDAAASQPASASAAPPARVAIVGLGGRYPGADSPRRLWRNLRDGIDSIGPLPASRQPAAGAWPPGGYLDDIARFDSLLFGIAPVEAASLDPQERLLLEAVWACLEDAGHTAATLTAAGQRVGVFVGAMWNDYQSVGLDSWRAQGKAAEFSHHASLANRISFVFDFAGPSLAVNTSCASGLTALHLAAESLRRGECEVAIAGGVNLLAHPYHAQVLADLGLLAAGGRARPLSADASGWAPGEGVGAVLLKALPRAEADGDHVYATIEASYVGHAGKSPRYGAPNARRQAEHLRRLLAGAGLVAADIDYIEAAAPGASLADAAELGAIAEVFGAAARATPCRVGTLKANIGHLESASGLSQLTKVVMQFAHDELAPTLASEPRSPLIDLDARSLAVVTAATPWPREPADRPRRALINSIGAAGSIGHLILAEHRSAPRAPRAPRADTRQLVVLSAATAEQLREQVGRLHDFLDTHADTPLDDLAFTLRAGRVAMRERLAIVAADGAELRARLRGAREGGETEGVYRGTVEDGVTAADAGVSGDDPARLGAAWVRGGTVDWRVLDGPGPRRIPLPTYPFEATRHWLAATPAAKPATHDATHALEARVHAFLVRELADATGIPAARITVDSPLEALGLNSMIIQALNVRLARDFPALPKTVFFEHRTLRSLAAYLSNAHRPALLTLLGVAKAGSVDVPPVAPVARAAARRALPAGDADADAIAIVGLAGRYPQADTLDALWRNLADGRDCIDEVPRERWDVRRQAVVDGPVQPSRWGGFLRDVDAFDPLFFNISPLDAERMDPQERLVLQTAWQAFEDAGYSRSALETHYQGRVGVFIGVMYSEYQLLPGAGQQLGVSGSYGSIANRVSYVLNLRGPSLAIDTMCSSSLTAIHLACESIRRGDCRCALAGGVNLSLHPNKYVTHALLNMPSSDGRCHSFGADGDGFVPGEGVGAVLLKPLGEAIADGDHIHGVIRATSINHGGKTNGYTVPNPDAQQALIAEALTRGGIDARAISYVEAHGTGTALGDPIEIAGLSRAFSEYTSDRQYCALGSVKSNIGHAESAAGIAGLTKVLLQMRHGQLAPSLHARTLNPNIAFEDTPFVVQQALAEWTRPVLDLDGERREYPRIAGVSSFGAGGANAHVIVEEYRPSEEVSPYRLPDGQPAL